jgi:hypothetical protein
MVSSLQVSHLNLSPTRDGTLKYSEINGFWQIKKSNEIEESYMYARWKISDIFWIS